MSAADGIEVATAALVEVDSVALAAAVKCEWAANASNNAESNCRAILEAVNTVRQQVAAFPPPS